MGTGASFGDTLVVEEEQVQNARLHQELLEYVTQLDKDGAKEKILEQFVDTGLAGTWLESFYNSELEIQITEFDSSNDTVDRAKYAASIAGTYKGGQGTIKGFLLSTRKSAQGVWKEGEHEGLFQFDLVENGLVFCGPFYHNGTYMGTWWGRNAQIRKFEQEVNDAGKVGKAGENGAAGGVSTEATTTAETLTREMLEREQAAKQEQAAAAAAKKKALKDRVAKRKQTSGRVIPNAISAQREPVAIQRPMVEDLLFDPNLNEDAIVAKMQASLDRHLESLGQLFAVGASASDPDHMPRTRLWSHICGKVEDLSIDNNDVDIMIGKVLREEDEGQADDSMPGGDANGSTANKIDFVHFSHFLFHLANAYTLMHEGMLGSDHSLDKVVPVLMRLIG